ncbi:hypothetical protein NDU88_004214 [Pleurodeles waltl]|uniref:Uncharacterized protein n=1 Tax=Pleurodeles waltl TaxID=8319 RepID=A0AAV7QHR5_PLEWA|nr:hypothetical protein NDU88_004214 [Pleurodeles waltl]
MTRSSCHWRVKSFGCTHMPIWIAAAVRNWGLDAHISQALRRTPKRHQQHRENTSTAKSEASTAQRNPKAALHKHEEPPKQQQTKRVPHQQDQKAALHMTQSAGLTGWLV